MKNINKQILIKGQDTWINWEYCKNCKFMRQKNITSGIYELRCKLNLNKNGGSGGCYSKKVTFWSKLGTK